MKKRRGRKQTGSKALGGLIKDTRTRKKLTGKQLADLVNVSKAHISKIEHGVHAPDFLVAKRISAALNEPEIMDLYIREQHPDINDYYAEAIALKKMCDELKVDPITWYDKWTKGEYTSPPTKKPT